MSGIQLIETISAEGDGYVVALRFVQKGVVNLTHHTMTQPQNIGIRSSRRGNWGIGTQRLGHGKPVISVPPSQRAVRRRAWRGERDVMQNRSNRGSGKPVLATVLRARAFDWDPIPRIALGPAATYAASTGRTHGCTRPIVERQINPCQMGAVHT